jgi:hypothetical protein
MRRAIVRIADLDGIDRRSLGRSGGGGKLQAWWFAFATERVWKEVRNGSGHGAEYSRNYLKFGKPRAQRLPRGGMKLVPARKTPCLARRFLA